MIIKCPKCHKVFNAPDIYIGKNVKCLECNHSFIVNSPIDKQQDVHENTTKEQPLINSKTITISDEILRLSFRFAKGISAIIIAICFVSLIGCFTILFVVQPKRVSVPLQMTLPNFLEFKQQIEKQRAQNKSQNELENTQLSVSPSQSIESQFGKQIDDLRKKWSITERQFLMQWLAELKSQNRSLFLSGLNTFIADSWEYKRKNPSAFTYKTSEDFARYYHDAFLQAEREYEEEVTSALAYNESEIKRVATNRKLILMSLVGSMGCLLAFLIIPLLIQIERNTRVLLEEK